MAGRDGIARRRKAGRPCVRQGGEAPSPSVAPALESLSTAQPLPAAVRVRFASTPQCTRLPWGMIATRQRRRHRAAADVIAVGSLDSIMSTPPKAVGVDSLAGHVRLCPGGRRSAVVLRLEPRA